MTQRTVGEVSQVTGLSVRTLHHYDDIGLVVPSTRSASGYRIYSDDDMTRLHQVCAYRELGFGLEEIATILDQPHQDSVVHLRQQHELLGRRIHHLEAVRQMIDTMIEAKVMDVHLTTDEIFEVFGDDDPGQYEEEARERWGDTDAYSESSRRARRYTVADWKQITREAAAIESDFAALLRSGASPGGEAATAVAERHRQHIERWFYACPTEMHRGLAEMYVADERFADHYDGREPGLAAYVREAIWASRP